MCMCVCVCKATAKLSTCCLVTILLHRLGKLYRHVHVYITQPLISKSSRTAQTNFSIFMIKSVTQNSLDRLHSGGATDRDGTGHGLQSLAAVNLQNTLTLKTTTQ